MSVYSSVLDIEPENQLIKEYQKTLRRYIRQGDAVRTVYAIRSYNRVYDPEREEQEDKKGEATESEADSDSEEDEESSAESKSSDDSSDDGVGGYEEKKSERNLSSEASRFRK